MPAKKCLFVLGFLYSVKKEKSTHAHAFLSVDEKVLPFSMSWVLFFDLDERASSFSKASPCDCG